MPLVLAPEVQVWALIGLTPLMSIPGTFLAVGFNGLFATTVPLDQWGMLPAHNTLLAITFVFTSLLCRQILARLPLPAGYQVVFVTSFMFGVLCLLSAFLILNRSRRYSSSERTS